MPQRDVPPRYGEQAVTEVELWQQEVENKLSPLIDRLELKWQRAVTSAITEGTRSQDLPVFSVWVQGKTIRQLTQNELKGGFAAQVVRPGSEFRASSAIYTVGRHGNLLYVAAARPLH